MTATVKRHTGLDAFRVSEETQVVLGLVAEARSVSVSQIVRDALDVYAASDTVEHELEQHRKRQERIRTLVDPTSTE